MIDFINLFDLIVEKFKNFLFALAFRSQSVRTLLRTPDRETFHLPSVLNPDDQLNLALEGHAQCNTLVCPLTDLQLEVNLLKLTEVLLQVLVWAPMMVSGQVVHCRLC